MPANKARTIGLWLPVEQLGVDPVLLDQPVNSILARTFALVTRDAQHVELAGDVAENDRAVARYHNHRSTRNARSIWAVAASKSIRFPVSAARRSNSAAKSQCGRTCRHYASNRRVPPPIRVMPTLTVSVMMRLRRHWLVRGRCEHHVL
jgi:ribosomal protein L39E